MRCSLLARVASIATASKAPRILCLHGGGSNAAVMRLQTAKLRAALPEVAFDFLEATRVMPAAEVDPRLRSRFGDAGFYNWYGVEYNSPTSPTKDLAAYVDTLLDPSVAFSYPGADLAMQRLEHAIRDDGPYDGLLGFSQGAVVITLLTAARLREGRGGPPDWRFNVCVCGMPSRASELAHLFEAPLPFPCALAFGTEDPFYPWATRLRDVFEAPAVIEFEEGHRFPHSRQANEQIVAAVRGLLGD